MVGEPQGAMCVALQIWQVIFALQTLPVFCLTLRKKAQYVVVIQLLNFTCSWFRLLFVDRVMMFATLKGRKQCYLIGFLF